MAVDRTGQATGLELDGHDLRRRNVPGVTSNGSLTDSPVEYNEKVKKVNNGYNWHWKDPNKLRALRRADLCVPG